MHDIDTLPSPLFCLSSVSWCSLPDACFTPPVSLRCRNNFVRVCLSADWTGAPYPFFPRFYHCRTKVLISFALACMLVCMPADWTGTLVLSLRFYRRATWILILFVLVCLSADWAGALVLLNSFLFVVVFLLAQVARSKWLLPINRTRGPMQGLTLSVAYLPF